MLEITKCGNMDKIPFLFSDCVIIITVFIQIVAGGTVNFSFARVRLLIESGSYSREVFFICFGPILGVVHKTCSTQYCHDLRTLHFD